MSTSSRLASIDDDVLLHVFSHLRIEDILMMRQVSKHFHAVSKLRIVWQQALDRHVIRKGYPFPNIDTSNIDKSELEACTRKAFALGRFWLAREGSPRSRLSFRAGSSATGIANVHFLPSKPGWIITVSKGIWSVVTCWDVGRGKISGEKIAEWSPRQTLITGLIVNSDPLSEGCLAISMSISGEQSHRIQIFAISFLEELGSWEFLCLRTIINPMTVMTLQGDLLAVSDDVNETCLINWETGSIAVLWGAEEASEHNFQHNRCLQVVFASNNVIVVRARSLETFRMPALVHECDNEDLPPAAYHDATARHQFGWIDGVSVVPQRTSVVDTTTQPLWIVLRAESDNPWSTDIQTLDLYILQPNTACDDETSSEEHTFNNAPYVFPPDHQASWVSAHGHLRCRDILVGSHGTALWIQPRPALSLGLTEFDVHSSGTQRPGQHSPNGSDPVQETLVAALLPSRMRDQLGTLEDEKFKEAQNEARKLWAFNGAYGSWTALAYDEARGLVALGDSQGNVEILEL